MMKIKPSEYETVITDFLNAFKVLQREASCVADVLKWIKENPALLRNVSQAVGHNVADELYERPAEVYEIRAREFEGLGCSHDPISHCDDFSHHNQVETYLSFYTDGTINLGLVFSKIPELGLQHDYFYSEKGFHDQSDVHLVFSPRYWSIAAAFMLYHLPDTNEYDLNLMHRICAEIYPNVRLELFNTLYKAGLFTDEVAVQDWMLVEQYSPSLAVTELPSNVL